MTQTVIIPEFTLEGGRRLYQVPVAYRTWGTLNKRRDNVIVVCHALTGDTNADQWWGMMIGSGHLLDTDRFLVICMNVAGSPYGTVSPLTVDPQTGEPYGATFPVVTIRDTVALHRQVLEYLGVKQVALVIGGSMGAMQVLEWGFYRSFVRALIPIAVGGRHSAWCIGWSEAQRQAIYADPAWQGGNYPPGQGPESGLAAARMMAMISYRSRDSFEERFGRAVMPANGSGAPFAVESYLRYQGEKLVRRFDANCYVRLTQQMDSHDVARGRGEYVDVLNSITQPTLVIGIDSDVLYPLSEQQELAEHMPNATLAVMHALHGHDSFLIDFDLLNELIHPWIETHIEDPAPAQADACL